MVQITDTVKHLLIINILVFVGTVTIGNGEFFLTNFSLFFPESNMFKPWQVITHMFMHAGPMHLFFNMLLLFFFGPVIERNLGAKRFIFLYFSAGLGATILPLIIDYFQFYQTLGVLVENGLDKNEIMNLVNEGKYNTGWESILGEERLASFTRICAKVSLGASGAIMGIMAAFAYMFPNAQLMLLIPPIPIKAKYLVTGMIGADLITAILTGTPLLASSNVGHWAHVGGALTGLLIVWYWRKTQFNKNRLDR